ncbi:malate dehydrogenase [Paenibacillus darwinianus]|uniref:Malate dehydrogenase n=1 Tax=Paenibacillus darwinianus TaxID=1380763 RepID=A0A9W5W7L4_9BACL|nr:malic enzyme-like NAD(P)-binding protein [Paenibacillus darwinianus]EXX88477.1 malate dehydrogenase [Paenibacillus darwinianus]EXX89275.1 malate dehydrogenase [Paenibacillus darwinianus]EXX89991.1 malate dehydrogenase [Paenibacillus darwinianus]
MASSTNIIIRMELKKETISFGEVAVAIGQFGADIIATDVIHSGRDSSVRDITVKVPDSTQSALLDRVRALAGVKVVNVSDRTFLVHLGGKIEVQPRMPIKNREDLSHVYTPGVAKVCKAIEEHPDKAFSLTIKRNMVAVVTDGALAAGVAYANPMWQWLAERTNPDHATGPLSTVIEGADVFVGVSGPGVLKVEDLRRMARDPIVFAMANPEPEIDPEAAEPYVRVLATGRSDYPNQSNNVLCFPGVFRGALECRARTINERMKLATAEAIASTVSGEELHEHYIIQRSAEQLRQLRLVGQPAGF